MGFAQTGTMLDLISFQISITTIQSFQKRYITFLYLKWVKKYELSKFEACCAGRILFRVSVCNRVSAGYNVRSLTKPRFSPMSVRLKQRSEQQVIKK